MTPAVVAASRYRDLPEVQVATFRAAVLWAWWQRHVHLVCSSAEVAEECQRLLRDRFGKAAADELVRISVRGGA